MATDLLTSAMIQSMARNLSVPDLIRTSETLKLDGRLDAVERLYASWVEHNREHPLLYAILFNYSVVLSDAGKLPAAREALEQAIRLNAEFMPAYINLGRVLERQGQAGLALVQWSAALARMAAVTGTSLSHKTTALNQSARVFENTSQDEAAEALLRQSLELDSAQREVAQHLIALRQRQCEWPVVLPSERVSAAALMDAMSPLSAAAYTDDPMLQLAMAWNYNRQDVGTPPGAFTAWPVARAHSGPLRIGYLCSDLREHALGFLLTEVFGLHDRRAVEVFAYYCGPEATDPLHAKFHASVDHWTSISALDDLSAARQIAADGVQILVDLNGYTREARLKVIALRPAPVIVNWLGYPGTMGSPYHHYLIADDWIIPTDQELYYSEQVLRLPCYQPSSRQRVVAAAPTRREAGLPDEGIVYCCFNGAHKISRSTLDRWLLILDRVPGSVLWLLSNTDTANARLRAYAAERGIAPERLVFAAKLANPHHLARYPLADLFLDSTPYGAHTTGSDALWMGVPVLTFSGRSFASRVCGSLVRAAGLPELITTTAEAYVERAVELGQDPARLRVLRDLLKARRDTCTLFDMPGLVRRLEEQYCYMWQQCELGRLPRPDLANLDVYLEVGSKIRHDEIEVQTIADYRGWWREQLRQRDQFRPIPPDRRLWNGV